MQSIILKKSAFSENNEIVSLYTRDVGKLRVIARAIKSPKSKLAFGLQSLFYSDIEFAQTKKSPIITGVRVLNPFKRIRESIDAVTHALYATELILKCTPDEEPNVPLFDYYLLFLEHLDVVLGTNHSGCTGFFVLHVLSIIGYGINITKCALCGNELSENSEIYFSNRSTGFIGPECAGRIADAKPLAPGLFAYLKTYASESFANQDSAAMDSDLGQKLFAFADSYLTHILERELKSGQLLKK